MENKEVFLLKHNDGEFFEISWKKNVFNVKEAFFAERFLSIEMAEKKKGLLPNSDEYTIVKAIFAITIESESDLDESNKTSDDQE